MTILTRRGLLGCACCAGVAAQGGLVFAPSVALAQAHGASSGLTPQEALDMLRQGNEAFVNDEPNSTPVGRERRLEIAEGQAPFVALVGCSDSRVGPEILFGRGLGELFIVRNAGNVVDTAAMGSVEYAVGNLGVPLVVVLGHERCGAVGAALSVVAEGATFPGSIGRMVDPILPAAIKAQAEAGEDADAAQVFEAAVRENVRRVATQLRTASPVLAGPLAEGKVMVVGAYYDLDEGRVEFFDEG
jgi:carbonic anhydrase